MNAQTNLWAYVPAEWRVWTWRNEQAQDTLLRVKVRGTNGKHYVFSADTLAAIGKEAA